MLKSGRRQTLPKVKKRYSKVIIILSQVFGLVDGVGELSKMPLPIAGNVFLGGALLYPTI